MNSSQLWQHPFVDVFKYVNVTDWKLAQKEGDVSECLDRVTGKRVIKLQGSVSAANFIQIPRVKGKLKNLGLTGRYLYIQLQVPHSKLFSMHFDYILSNLKTKAEEPLRLSFTNIFKETKASQACLQLATPLGEKWTVLCADIPALVNKYYGSHLTSHVLRSFTICSNLVVRGVFTSDILYTAATLPKEMMFKLNAQSKWHSLYDWFHIEENNENQLVAPVAPAPKAKPPEEVKSLKHVKFEDVPEELPVKKTEERLLPDPIMQLANVVGYSGAARSNIKWTRFGTDLSSYPPEFTHGSEKFLVFPAGAVVVLMNPVTRRQFHLTGNKRAIKCLAISKDGRFLATGEYGTDPSVLIWDLNQRKAPVSVKLDKVLQLKSVGFSSDNSMIVAAGTDAMNKENIFIYTVRKAPKLLVKQQSNYHINTIKFSPIHNDRLVSCGKENIRFWRVNKDNLSGGAVVLSHHSRSSEFLDLDFEVFTSSTKSPDVDDHLKRVFVTSDQGILFQVNYKSMELEGAFQLHEGKIESVTVSEGFCVTGSSDNFLRVWALDFSEYVLEAHHENGGIAGVDITPDGLFVVCGTGNSAIGILDMTNNSYTTLVRAHSAEILDLDVRGDWFMTAARDGTIRLWSTLTFEEAHEFTSTEDMPLTLSFHPTLDTFACGFQSGTVLIFELQGSQALHAFIQHEFPLVKVQHSPDGKWLVSISTDGTMCLYDVERNYVPVKTIQAQARNEHVDACFSKNSQWLALLGSDKSNVCLVDMNSLKIKVKIPTTDARAILFSPSDKELIAITGGNDFRVKTYTFEGKVIREVMRMHRNAEVTAFAATHQHLVSGGSDRVLKVWRNKNKAVESQTFFAHSSAVSKIKFAAEGRLLLTTAKGGDGVFIWDFYGATTGEASPKAVEVYEEFESSVENPLEFCEPASEPAKAAAVELERIIGFNSDAHHNVVWKAELGWFMHTSGSIVVQTLLRNSNDQRFFRTPLSFVNKVAVNPAGTVMACAGDSEGKSAIYIYDIMARTVLRELNFHEHPIEVLQFSDCGRYLVSVGSSQERVLVLWEWDVGKVLNSSLLESPVSQLKWIKDSEEFITVGETVTHWRLSEGQLELSPLRIFTEPQEVLTSVDVFQHYVYVGSSTGRLFIYNLRTSRPPITNLVLGSRIRCICAAESRVTLGGDCNHIVSFIHNEDVTRSQEALTLDGYTTGLEMEPQGNEGIVSTVAGSIWYINWTKQTTIRIASTHMTRADILDLSSGPLIASCSTDKSLRLWEPIAFNEVLQETSQNAECNCLCFSPFQPLLVAGFSDGCVKFYDVTAMKMMGKAKVFNSGVKALAWQGTTLIVGSDTGLVNIIRCNDWTRLNVTLDELGAVGGGVCCIEALEDTLLASSDTGRVTVWHNREVVDVLNILENPHGEEVDNTEDSLHFSQSIYSRLSSVQTKAVFIDSEFIACIASALQYIYIRDTAQRETVKRVVLPFFPSTLCMYGRRILLGTTEGPILDYSTETDETETVQAHSHKVSAMTLTKDRLVTGASCQLMVWRLN